MSDRFYVPHLLDGSPVSLTGGEAHHLMKVMRLDLGDEAVLFDGLGNVAAAEIVSLSKQNVELRVLKTEAEPEDNRRALVLGSAVPKGDRFRWLVEKATELGVRRLVPLKTTRSVVHPGTGKMEKMEQAVIAACKQSGRNRLMRIEPRSAWHEFVAREFPTRCVLIAHPSGDSFDQVFAHKQLEQDVVAAIGPEGGFTETELEAATAAGAKLVNLGPHILRTETAAIAMAAILMQRLL